MKSLDHTTASRLCGAGILLSLLGALPCKAHFKTLHPLITEGAAFSSDGIMAFLGDVAGAANYPFTNAPRLAAQPPPGGFPASGSAPLIWLENGSYWEDKLPRMADHFYTIDVRSSQRSVYGLTDDEEFWLPGGIVDSFTWATVQGIPGVGYGFRTDANVFKWQDARTYEYAAFTNSAKADREEKLAWALYALGHVLHLNQDLTSPDHVRNDEHVLPSKKYIENYGQYTYLPAAMASPAARAQMFPQRPRGLAYWRANGFNKLKDFWDRGVYTGSPAALNADAVSQAGSKLGLGEFSNGNFIGEDAVYREYFYYPLTDIHYFPFPSLRHSTDFNLTAATIAGGVRPTFLPGEIGAYRVFISKVTDGVFVTNHSVLLHTGVVRFRKISDSSFFVSSTVDDPQVLTNYHSILIPKAIEYSAGILDYFFRGKLGVCPSFAAGQGQSRLQIQNVSGTSFQAGAFHLLWDDSTGNRTELQPPDFTTPDYNGALADGATTTARFTAQNNAVSYTLVYQGSVGTSDPVDADIAVASAKILPNRWGQLAWGTPFISATGTGTASFTPSGATGASFDAAASGLDDFFGVFPGSGGGGAENTGTLSYRGNALCCNLHLVCDKDTIDSCAGVSVQGINGLYVGQSFNYNEAGGTLDLPFTIPDTQGQTDTISVYVICEAPCTDGESGQAVHVHISGTFGP